MGLDGSVAPKKLLAINYNPLRQANEVLTALGSFEVGQPIVTHLQH